MAIRVKRVYDKPAAADGTRLLVDRLWPRGVSKDEARVAKWVKEFAPSDALRKWFHEDVKNRFTAFERKYHGELRKNRSAIQDRLKSYGQTLTLVTSVRDIEHSHIPVLKRFLETLTR